MYWVEYRITSEEIPDHRWEHSATEVEQENKIILYGGTNGKKYFEDLWLLRVQTEEYSAAWTKLETSGQSPPPLCGHTATLIGRNLYLFGGRNERGSSTDLYVLDIDLKHWQKVPTFGISPCARFSHTAVLIPGTRSIGIFGGTAGDRRFSFQDFFVLDTSTKEWTMLFPQGDPPQPRYSHSCESVDDKVIIFGGKDSDVVLDDLHILKYDTDSQVGDWKVETNTKGGPESRFGHASFSYHSKVFIWGGLTSKNTLSHEFFSYDGGSWSCHHEYEFTAPIGRVFHSCTRIRHHVLILGGSSEVIIEHPNERDSLKSSSMKKSGSSIGSSGDSMNNDPSLTRTSSRESTESFESFATASSVDISDIDPKITLHILDLRRIFESSERNSIEERDMKRYSILKPNLPQLHLSELSGPLTSPENLSIIVSQLFNKKTGAIRLLIDDNVAFSGHDILHWIVQTLRIDRAQALIIGKALQVEGYLENALSDKATFTDSSDLYQPTLLAKEEFQLDLTIDLKTETNRSNIINEIVATERKYVFDLSTLIEIYMKPLLSQFKDSITPGQSSNIFSNVNQIEKLNSELLSRLVNLQQLPTEEQFIGKLFVEMSFLFRSYTTFCVNQSVADRDIKVIKKNPMIYKFLEEQRSLPECGKLDLESYIIKPLQRICRYPLLLRELLKNTYETHPDYKYTQQALSQFDDVVRDINEKKRASENQMAIIELQQLFFDDVQLLKPARKLLLDADMKKITATGSTSKRHVFLFNDLLVIAEEKLAIGNQKYKLKDSVPIRNCIVWDDSGKNEKSQRTFVIVRNDKKEKIKLQADTIKTKQEWVNEINNCIIGPLNILDKDSASRRKAMEAFKAIQSGSKPK